LNAQQSATSILEIDQTGEEQTPRRRLFNWRNVNHIDVYSELSGNERIELFFTGGERQILTRASAKQFMEQFEKRVGYQGPTEQPATRHAG
jgi:hypothetical protein